MKKYDRVLRDAGLGVMPFVTDTDQPMVVWTLPAEAKLDDRSYAVSRDLAIAFAIRTLTVAGDLCPDTRSFCQLIEAFNGRSLNLYPPPVDQ